MTNRQDIKKLLPNDILPARVLIVGLGKSGLSCARFLARYELPVVIADSREEPPELSVLQQEIPAAKLFLGELDAIVLKAYDLLIISPGVSLREPAVAAALESGVEVMGDVELFARLADAPVVAITGSNGKSTVTAMVGDMARQARIDVRVGGNIGIPVLDLLKNDGPDLYVIELSSFQLETTSSLKAVASVILNISSDHMDRYRDIEEYRVAKERVYLNNGQDDGVVVVNKDDPLTVQHIPENRHCVFYGLSSPQDDEFGVTDHDGEPWLAKGKEMLLPVSAITLVGAHNISNALAALALGEAAGIPMSAMLKTLENFKGLPHRMEKIISHDGVDWYNDSKGTNVGATVASLSGLPGKVVLIAGGLSKGQDFAPLRAVIAEKARGIILIGRDAPLISAALSGLEDQVPMVHAVNMKQAVQQARLVAKAGDTVLLSPACASFDMFSGFEERGRAFCLAVREVLV